MFTGIVEEIGIINRIDRLAANGIRFRIHAPASAHELQINDSISISGACHTVVERQQEMFDVVSVEETLKKTNLGQLAVASRVNLELPMKLNERIGGHLVLGHVDAVGSVDNIEQRETSWMFGVTIPKDFTRYLIPTGSITVDGVSLTTAELTADGFRVSIIPHTMEKTIFSEYRVGTIVNLEFDVVGKYIVRLLQGEDKGKMKSSSLNVETLREMGF